MSRPREGGESKLRMSSFPAKAGIRVVNPEPAFAGMTAGLLTRMLF
jgi:hypothetical protein